MLYHSIIAFGVILQSSLAAANTPSGTRTANYDSIPTGAPPSPYKGLNYTNTVVSEDTSSLAPYSGAHYIKSTSQFDFMIFGSNYFQLNSLAIGCTGCIGTDCAGGIQPIPCNVSAVGVVTEGLPTNYAILSYTPKESGSGPLAAMQNISLAAEGVGGIEVHFSLLTGNGQTNVFFDNLVYTFE